MSRKKVLEAALGTPLGAWQRIAVETSRENDNLRVAVAIAKDFLMAKCCCHTGIRKWCSFCKIVKEMNVEINKG